jgi:hypothetical protein
LPPPAGARKGLPYKADAGARKGLPYKTDAGARKGLPYKTDAGARKGLPYRADAFPRRTTRTDLYDKSVIDSEPRTQVIKDQPEGTPGRLDPYCPIASLPQR